MKKFISILATVALCICFPLLAACGADETDDDNTENGSGYYTVTFDSLGGSDVQSQRVFAGNPARTPASPTKENFEFNGWYLYADGGELWNFFTDRVNGDITLYAHWTEIQEPPEPTATLTFALNAAETEYTVTGDGGQAANIVIPAEYDGKPVTAVADSAFAYSRHPSDIISVIIPDSVKEIGKNAFYNQDALESVNIGAGSKLEKIGNNAFSGNGALKSIYLPAGLNLIGDSVFNNCGGLDEISVASGNARYSGEGNCLIDLETGTLIRGSNNSVIPETVTKIGEAAFRKATLTTLTVPASVTSIDKYAIQNSAIEKIIYEGMRAQWEDVLKSSHKNWNMGKTDVQIACSDD